MPPVADHRVRVLLVSPTFGAYGGMEAFVLAVAATLAHDQRFAVRLCFKRAAGFFPQPDFERACEKLPVEFCARASAALWSAVSWADVVHLQHASPDVAAIAALCRTPLALSIHNVLPRGPVVRRLSWRLAARSAQARWYNSRFVWHSWEPVQHLASSALVPPTSQLPTAWVPPSSRRGIVFLGRLVEGKGADVLIDAYAEAGLDPDACPLTVMGDGPLRVKLEQRCAHRRIRGVRFTGFVEGEVKARTLAASRWLVAPSDWQEPFGLVAIEARSAGVPCIVTADGGLPEAAGREALVCQPGDAQGLAGLLLRAESMPEEEYVGRAERTRAGLREQLPSRSFYADALLRLARGLPAVTTTTESAILA